MKYQIANKTAEAKKTESNDSWDTYTVTVDGEEVGTIEKSIQSERKRYTGKMYGYDTAPRATWRVITARETFLRGYLTHSSLKAAVEYLVNNLI